MCRIDTADLLDDDSGEALWGLSALRNEGVKMSDESGGSPVLLGLSEGDVAWQSDSEVESRRTEESSLDVGQ